VYTINAAGEIGQDIELYGGFRRIDKGFKDQSADHRKKRDRREQHLCAIFEQPVHEGG